ncbi:MAG: 2-C-methyl-D-erythritol 2,4-cyclodiphosphate synthase [Actinomycetota bacterium]|nr:2-C-methyl-D-erythritol 2,4-cyclodiphosphate synthase [Actinomycetota bacterium]
MLRSWVIIVAGGTGSRFGRAKQYEPLLGRRVIDWAVDAARSVADSVAVVVPAADVPSERARSTADVVVAGGASRSASVRAGLDAVAAADGPVGDERDREDAFVLVHDGARPLATAALFRRVLAALVEGADAVVPAVMVTDTIRWAHGGTLDRSTLRAVQTPQGFRASILRAAHDGAPEATDDIGLVEAIGGTVVAVTGESHNLKITDPDDLVVAEALARRLAAEPDATESAAMSTTPTDRSPDPGPTTDPVASPASADPSPTRPAIRIGQGFDIHPISDDPARELVLGGVRFEGAPGLAGHSDADVIAHACTDALLGAAGLGDIGQHFPDTDERFSGADSIVLLTEAVRRVREAGWVPVNVDCSVVLDTPKLAPRRAEMHDRLTAAVGAPVTVKGKRPEGIGALGRHEGVACFAVALVESSTVEPS